MLSVKLPLQLLMVLLLLFNIAYLAAYNFFNDERFGRFLGSKLGLILDGDLTFESLHWNPMLIIDLLTGRPHKMQGYGVEVWEAYKLDGVERSRRTAYAEHLEVELVLHEIIPWNRLGVPKLVEIPWVLHFTKVRSRGEAWFDVRAYQNPHRDGAWMLSLIDAFQPAIELDPPPELKRLSYRVDHGELDGVALTLDLEERSGWATRLEFDELDFSLGFDNWAPAEDRPELFPLSYAVTGRGATGSLTIAPLVDEPIAVEGLERIELASGMNDHALGDLWIDGDGVIGGSPAAFSGRLIDVFGELAFDFRLGTTNVGPLVALLFPPEPDDAGRERAMVEGTGARASLEVAGPADEVELSVVGQGLTLDLFPEPAWALDDVDVSLTLAQDELPEQWSRLSDHPAIVAAAARRSGEAGEPAPAGPDPGEDPGEDEPVDNGQRWVVYLDTFRGSAFDGSVRLHRRGGQDHIVLKRGEDEPLLVAIYLDLDGVNLGQLTPKDPELSAMLAGSTRGGLQIHEVVIADGGLAHAEAELHRVDITRDRGPADDNLPRRVRADGDVIWDAETGLDLRGLRIGVDGGLLRLSGGVDANFEQLRPTAASLRVDDGEAFLRAFGLPRWFDALALDFSAAGPLTNPRGSGSLDVAGAGSGALAVDDIQAAQLKFERGKLSLRSRDVAMLGGRGPLEADLVLLANGKPLADPRVRLEIELRDIDRRDILGSGIGAENATIELRIDDGDGKPVRLSQLQARGGAYADTLTLAGVDYRDATASFAFTREGIEIDRMNLAYHRPVSPALRPGVSVPVGQVGVTGTVGFDDDPSLDLDVEARNVPLSALAASFGEGLPIRGQISRGSRLKVSGTLSRPEVDGQLALSRLAAAGVPLGDGVLEFSGADLPARPADPSRQLAATAAHRQVRIEGRLSGKRNQSASEGDLDWGIDATVAFGGGPKNPIEAAVDLSFANLPLDTLLAHPSRDKWRTHVIGGLQRLVVETRYCPSHDGDQRPMLAACAGRDAASSAGENAPSHDPLTVDISLAQLWFRGRRNGEAVGLGADPCLAPDATCSVGPLRAQLDGSRLSFVEPWRIRSGGKQGPLLEVDGAFDLTGDGEAIDSVGSGRCIPGTPDNASLPPGDSKASISGALDLAALGPVLSPWGLDSPDGRLELELDLAGVVTRPTITGYIRLPQDQPLELSVASGGLDERGRPRSRPIPITVSAFALRMAGGTIYLEQGVVEVYDELLKIGEVGRHSTYLDVAGPCAGRFGLAAGGSLDGAVLRKVLPDLIDSASGSVQLRKIHASGDLARFGRKAEQAGAGEAQPLLDTLRGSLAFTKGQAIRLGVNSLGDLRVASGQIEFRQCTPARPCGPRPAAGGEDLRRRRGVAVWLGGPRSAASATQPSDALAVRVGERGGAGLWGEVVLADDFSGLDSARLAASANMFPISLPDNSGRTELEASLSSDRIVFTTDGQTGRIFGDVLIERSSWLRDARQGVAVLSFADPVPAPPSQLPDFVRDLELDLTLRTAAPFRVDNNVAKKLEARADLRLGGTIGDPDLNGSIDVERGVVDLDILGGAYDVERGRVVLSHDVSQSVIDLYATRQEPIKINNQLLTLNLRLSGTLDAIQWECSAAGDTSGALATTRGCVDYLIFDAGNTDLAQADIRENRNDNNLLGTRFLPLAGRLTQIEINEVLAREVPRVETYLPYVRFRVDQLGVVIDADTRPEWLRWGWGRLGLNFTYLRGYPGSVIRDSRSFSGRLEILENAALEATFGNRNYSNRVLILDPPRYQSIQFIQRLEIPSAR